MSDMINFNEFISNAEPCKERLYDDNNEIEYDTELYQLIGKKDSNIAHIKIVGKSNGKKPVLKLNEFKILDDKFVCILYQHVYLKPEISQLKKYKLVSLDILNNNCIFAELSLEFHCTGSSDIMTGKYVVILYENNRVIELYKIDKYPGSSNVVELLMKFISHEKVLDLFVQ